MVGSTGKVPPGRHQRIGCGEFCLYDLLPLPTRVLNLKNCFRLISSYETNPFKDVPTPLQPTNCQPHHVTLVFQHQKTSNYKLIQKRTGVRWPSRHFCQQLRRIGKDWLAPRSLGSTVSRTMNQWYTFRFLQIRIHNKNTISRWFLELILIGRMTMQHFCSRSSSLFCGVQNSLLLSANGYCTPFVQWAITIFVYNGFLTPDVFNYSKNL